LTRVVVELFGLPRLLAGCSELEVELAPGARVREALAALAHQQASLVGRVLVGDGQGVHPHYSVSLNGDSFSDDLDTPVHQGDRILIMSTPAGG